jgi:hypothetical protein
MNGAALPNTVKLELLKHASTMSSRDFLSFLNTEISKAWLGQSFTTEAGANGNRSAAETAKEGTLEIYRYDARCLADTLECHLALPWMRLNYPNADRKLCPRVRIMVDDEPEASDIMKLAVDATGIDVPVNLDKLAERTGLDIVAVDDLISRRTRMLSPKDGPNPPEDGDEIDDEENEDDDTLTESDIVTDDNGEQNAPPKKPEADSAPKGGESKQKKQPKKQEPA